ncbi:MAG TPA: DUF5615 family PIN-like protein [Bryobacteraceae bacterium]|nr:DUF5615 family PIN-like protein [Bryobacteraceae bacterium]
MSVTLLLDQGVPRDAAGKLRDLGYECLHVGEIGMSTADDPAILAFALGKNAIVVTLDADLHRLWPKYLKV